MSGLRASARLLPGVGLASIALMLAACNSSGQVTSNANGTLAPTASPTQSLGAVLATRGVPVASTSLATSPPASAPASTPESCAQFAANTFLYVTTVQAETDASLTLTGNLAAVVCGGPDDLHYNPAAATVTAHVLPGAAITVFAHNSSEPMAHSELAAYVATDTGTRIFLVHGPLNAISGLQEQYHP